MLVCRKTGDGFSDPGSDDPIQRRAASSGQAGPVFLPRRKLSAIGEAVLRNDQHLSRMDDVAADPVGALER